MKGIREAALSAGEETMHPLGFHDYSAPSNASRVTHHVTLDQDTKDRIVEAFEDLIDRMARDPFVQDQAQAAVNDYLEIKAEEDKDGIDTTGAFLDCMDDIGRCVDLHTDSDQPSGNSELVQIAASMLAQKLGLKFEGKPVHLPTDRIPGDLDEDAYDIADEHLSMD